MALLFDSPPHDTQLEVRAIGCILMRDDDEWGKELLKTLVPADFYDSYYRNVFTVMKDLDAAGTHVDFASVAAAANGKEWFERLGGSGFLAKICTENVQYFPSRTLIPSLRKFTLIRMQRGFQLLHENPEENMAALKRAQDEYMAMLPTQARKAVDFKNLLKDADPIGIPTGLHGIDTFTGGMSPGQFIVIGARTGVGKSIMLMNIAAHVCQMGKRVLWVGLEMSEREVLKRFMKHLSDANHVDSIDYLETMDIIAGSKTASQLEAEAARGMYDVIVLDYLQIVRPEQKFTSDVQRLEDLTRRMKQLAMEHNNVVLAAAQLNRESEIHTRAPKISDLRGSGSIEADADIVMLIHRIKNPDEVVGRERKKNLTAEAVAASFEGKGDTTVYVEKNRAGREGSVSMTFDPQRLRFVDPSVPPAWIENPTLGM